MKTNKDFNLSKTSKRALAALPNDKRGHWKKMMIDAEVAEKRAKLAKLSGMKSQSNQGEE
jgi:hypothetical protein